MSIKGQAVYVVIVEDRRIDTEATVFYDPDEAKAAARQPVAEAAEHANDDVTEELTVPMIQDGWIYYCCTYDDGPRARVLKRTIK